MKDTRIFIAAICIAIISWFLLKEQIQKEQEETIGEMVRVVVAETDIPRGTTLTRKFIKPGQVPQQFLSPTTILAQDVDTILGNTTSRDIRSGMQVSWDDLTKSSSYLSGELPDSMRAFTLEVDPGSTQGGQLRPGDHVDVLAIFNTNESPSCSTILQDIKIMAVGGNRLDHGISSGFADVTLILTPEQCQHLALARETGTVILTLRSPHDHNLIKTPPTQHKDLGQVTYDIKQY